MWFFFNMFCASNTDQEGGQAGSNEDAIVSLLNTFNELTEGLLFMSESDFPFTSYYWSLKSEGSLSTAQVLAQIGRVPETKIQTRAFNDFFDRLTDIKDSFDDQQKQDAKRFQALKEALEENLDDLLVYKVGEIQIGVFIVGKTKFGAYVGLSTISIET